MRWGGMTQDEIHGFSPGVTDIVTTLPTPIEGRLTGIVIIRSFPGSDE